MTGRLHGESVRLKCLEAYKKADGKLTLGDISRHYNIPVSTIRGWVKEGRTSSKIKDKSHIFADIELTSDKPIVTAELNSSTSPRILIFDIETSPNRGFFFDCYSDRGIPLQFIESPKSVLTVAYKWYGEKETKVLIAAPYNDKHILEEFLFIFQTADYVVAHFGDGFDIPFLAARAAANNLPPLPTVTSIDTYKLAKKHFGRSLNSNKLDHLGEIFGVGNKNKTDATLWVRCANGDAEALKEMAAYNIQDVELLERVFIKLLPYVKTKINHNLFIDNPTRRCKPCGSEALEVAGYEYSASTIKDRMRCMDCKAYSIFSMRKQ